MDADVMRKTLEAALAERIVSFLNQLIELDRPAVAALLANRIPCNQALADHPTVQVSSQHGGFHVGLLGILNGLCGIHEDGNGLICAEFDTTKSEGVREFASLIRFRLTHEEKEKKRDYRIDPEAGDEFEYHGVRMLVREVKSVTATESPFIGSTTVTWREFNKHGFSDYRASLESWRKTFEYERR